MWSWGRKSWVGLFWEKWNFQIWNSLFQYFQLMKYIRYGKNAQYFSRNLARLCIGLGLKYGYLPSYCGKYLFRHLRLWLTPCRSARVSHTHVSSNVREWQLGDHKLICIRDKICLKPLSAISFRPLDGTTGSNAAVKSPIWNLVRHRCNV